MSISEAVRLLVRQRANFSCEFCGVSETDSGGELTVDHFRPQSRQGGDDPENLIYTCGRCNQYKSDYWPARRHDLALWNPRTEPITAHLLPVADGTLFPITPIGAFSLKRLRLNRPALVAYRLRHLATAEEQRLLSRYRDVVTLLERLSEQQIALMEEQRALLEEQRALLRLLLQNRQ